MQSEAGQQEPASISSHAGAEFFCRSLLSLPSEPGHEVRRILVVGSGSGHEAAYIMQRVNAKVDAIDVRVTPRPEFRGLRDVRFSRASVEALPFADGVFDAAFYHHVIEHVDDPSRSLSEVARVVKPAAWVFVGTPNRHRLLSAVGAHDQSVWKATLANKVRENISDWRARLTGRFRNELGAHAGFSAPELDRLLAHEFHERRWVTREYLRFKYSKSRYAGAVRLASSAPFMWFSAPSVYAFCRQAGRRP